MRCLDGRRLHRLRTLAHIPQLDEPVVASANDDIGVLLVVLERHDGRWGCQLGDRQVGVGRVPHEGHGGHRVGDLLEPHDRVGCRQLGRALGVPADLGRCATNTLYLILEEHECLGGEVLGAVLHRLALKVLLKNVDGVVLLEVLGGVCTQMLDGRGESGVLVQPLAPLGRLLVLRGIHLLRPAPLDVFHALACNAHSLRVDGMLRELWYVVGDEVSWVLRHEPVSEAGLCIDHAEHLGVAVLKIAVPPELLAELRVHVVILIHGANQKKE
mmetsp:Transcript_52483/g.131901  ORF Transcript_52483/g.131901 Transcript_52483/m.131901 type:complete len:271 (-) Transcript_52483:131-943(-)